MQAWKKIQYCWSLEEMKTKPNGAISPVKNIIIKAKITNFNVRI